MNLRLQYIYIILAVMILTACSSDGYVGNSEPDVQNSQMEIRLNTSLPNATRADLTGAAAAVKINNKFIVWGEKNEKSDGTAAGGTGAEGNLVFQNYVVQYGQNTAGTTASNSSDWEYVGVTPYNNNVTPATPSQQTIKYWDHSASAYVFTAVSAKPDDISSGKVKITKTTSGVKNPASASLVHEKGYSIELSKGSDASSPDVNSLYFSNREEVAKANYNKPVAMKFQNVQSRVRVAMYETVPGYKVKIDKFSYQGGESTTNFVAEVPNYPTTSEGTLTITYAPTTNTPQADFAKKNNATADTYISLGTNLKAEALTTNSASALFDKSNRDYTTFFPMENNNQPLKLTVDYTLIHEATNEPIHITGAVAMVPATYLKWKPNHGYTYLFKITDSNLQPITFDGVEITEANGNSSFITTTSDPSITTFGYNPTNGVYIDATADYPGGHDIYAVFKLGEETVKPKIGDTNTNIPDDNKAYPVNIYKANTVDAKLYPITEASVAECLAHPYGNKLSVRNINDESTPYFTEKPNFTEKPSVVTQVPGPDKESNGDTKMLTIDAVKLTGVNNGVFVIEFWRPDYWTSSSWPYGQETPQGHFTKVYKVIYVGNYKGDEEPVIKFDGPDTDPITGAGDDPNAPFKNE